MKAVSYPVEHVFCVGGWDAEPRPGLDDGRSGEAHDHHPDVPLQHLPAKRSGGSKNDTRTQHRFHEDISMAFKLNVDLQIKALHCSDC